MEGPADTIVGWMRLDRSECNVGETIGVFWSFPNYSYVASSEDWIGMFKVGEADVKNLLDWKDRSEFEHSTGAEFGSVTWNIKKGLLITDSYTKPEYVTAVNFCYFRFDDVLLLKSSPPLVVNYQSQLDLPLHPIASLPQSIEPFQIKVCNVHCTGLYWHLKYPNPVLEFHLTHHPGASPLPHHGQKITSTVVENTINPKWTGVFCFMVLQSDILEIDVKNDAMKDDNRSFRSSVKVPLCQFLKWKGETTLTFALKNKAPNDLVPVVPGILTLTVKNKSLVLLPDIQEFQQADRKHKMGSGIATLSSQGEVTPRGVPQTNKQSAGNQSEQQQSNDSMKTANGSEAIPVVNETAESFSLQNKDLYASILRRGSTKRNAVAHPIKRKHSLHASDAVNYAMGAGRRTKTSTSSETNNLSQMDSEDLETAVDLLHFMQRSFMNEHIRHLNGSDDNKSVATHFTSEVPSTKQLITAPSANILTTLTEECTNAVMMESDISYSLDDDDSDVQPLDDGEASMSQTLTGQQVFERMQTIDHDMSKTPGFQFLTRPDLYQYAVAVGNTTLFSDKEALKMIQSIRADHLNFQMYCNSTVLINILNSFAKTDCALPPHWEKKIDRKTKKVVFIDHNNHVTTFIDPRLPYEGNNLTPRQDSAPAVMRSRVFQSSSSNAQPTTVNATRAAGTSAIGASGGPNDTSGVFIAPQLSYGDRVVAFMRRPDIYDVMSAANNSSMSSGLRSAIDRIRRDGKSALESIQRTCDDDISLELMIILSVLNDEIGRYSQAPVVSIVEPRTGPSNTSGAASATAERIDPLSILYARCAIHVFNRDYQAVINGKGSSLSQTQIRSLDVMKGMKPEVLSSSLMSSTWLRDIVSVFDEEIQAELQFLASENPQAAAYAYSDKVVSFLRQPRLFDILSSRPTQQIYPRLRMAIEQIRIQGNPALEEIQRESDKLALDLSTLLSAWDAEIQQHLPDVQPWVERRSDEGPTSSTSTPAGPTIVTPSEAMSPLAKNHFAIALQSLQNRWELQSEICLSIRREYILADAFSCIMRESVTNLQTRRCKVTWVDEASIDAGGPSREFFFKLSRELFNPHYGLFQYSNSNLYTIEISPFASQIEDSLQWFKFAGRVIGFAIIQGYLLDVFFAPHFYKALLNKPFSMSDIEAIDVSFYNSLVYLQENDPEDLLLTFSVEEDTPEKVVEVELKKGGSKIPVTKRNKKEYIKLMVNWRLSRGVQEQMEALIAGLRELIPLKYLSPFDVHELEWVIAGTPEINLEDWKANTVYCGGYSAQHKVIIWFWETVESYSNEQQLRLLQFVTGTSSIPFGGFKVLGGGNRFTIQMLQGNSDMLPMLDLPCYNSAEDLRTKLTLAVEECEDFALN